MPIHHLFRKLKLLSLFNNVYSAVPCVYLSRGVEICVQASNEENKQKLTFRGSCAFCHYRELAEIQLGQYAAWDRIPSNAN
jgi:hypothetical protein